MTPIQANSTCSKSTFEKLEKGVKYVKTPKRRHCRLTV